MIFQSLYVFSVLKWIGKEASCGPFLLQLTKVKQNEKAPHEKA